MTMVKTINYMATSWRKEIKIDAKANTIADLEDFTSEDLDGQTIEELSTANSFEKEAKAS